MTDELKITWQTLATQFTSAGNLIEECWQEIESAYTAQGRFYHNLEHLAFMLALAKRYEKQLQNPAAVAFAIFYHDLVYEPSRTDNEARSAEIASRRLSKLNVPAPIISFVEKAIAATKTHQTTSSSDSNFLLDFDLAILGADPQTYSQYAQNIRQEYGIYPDEQYKPGRRKVIQHFLAQPAIYKTPLFQTLLEARAHLNLQAELQDL